MELQGKKLVLVGGAGLIGSHTVDQLVRHDVKEIVIYDNFVRGRVENLQSALKDPRVKIFDMGGDVLHTDILEAALAGADGVFHLAYASGQLLPKRDLQLCFEITHTR